MRNQITYVIVNEKEELFAGGTTKYFWWTVFINKATLFDNKHLAEQANKEAKGIVMRIKYTLEKV